MRRSMFQSIGVACVSSRTQWSFGKEEIAVSMTVSDTLRLREPEEPKAGRKVGILSV